MTLISLLFTEINIVGILHCMISRIILLKYVFSKCISKTRVLHILPANHESLALLLYSKISVIQENDFLEEVEEY